MLCEPSVVGVGWRTGHVCAAGARRTACSSAEAAITRAFGRGRPLCRVAASLSERGTAWLVHAPEESRRRRRFLSIAGGCASVAAESVLSAGSPHVVPDVGGLAARQRLPVTILWFIVWLIANNVGGHEPLVFNPVNAWTATLILVIGLDLAAAHARGTQKGR